MKQNFIISVTVDGDSEDDRLKKAYETFKEMSFSEFAMCVDFDDVEEEECDN